MDFKRYSKLLIIQYQNDFNRKFIEILTQLFIEQVVNIVLKYKTNFNLDKAEGIQLDLLGALIGLPRDLNRGAVINDNTYRFLIYLKILKNSVNYNDLEFKEAFFFIFKKDIIFVDNHNMSVDFFFINIEEELFNILISDKDEFLPAPAGVRIEGIKPLDMPIFCFLDIKNESQIKEYERIVFFNDVNSELIDGLVLDIDIIF